MHKLMKSKTTQLIIVIFLVASIIATGTYAWSGFFGKANTGTPRIVPEEVQLFDFSAQLGEIYVVNNTNDEMLVRLKLVQNLRSGGRQLIPGTLADDPNTWPVDHELIQKYFRPVFSTAVVKMEDWKREDAPIGDHWVSDRDGWYYYAKKLAPGEATRTLITEVTPNQFNELVDGEYQTATFIQSVTKQDLVDLLRLDVNSFSSDGRLMLKYLCGEMVEFAGNNAE